jgi:hypothetical protein
VLKEREIGGGVKNKRQKSSSFFGKTVSYHKWHKAYQELQHCFEEVPYKGMEPIRNTVCFGP